MMIAGVLLAGGTGRRFGSELPKQMQSIDGEPLLARSLRILSGHSDLDVIVLVAHPAWRSDIEAIAHGIADASALLVVNGGSTRNDSTLCGLRALDDEVATVVIHDAARPFVTHDLLSSAILALEGADAVLPVIETVDLIARVQNEMVTGFADRTLLWRGQTPQVFRRSALQGALEYDAARPTRHATLYEALLAWAPDSVIRAIPGDVHNIKLTVPVDALTANAISVQASTRERPVDDA